MIRVESVNSKTMIRDFPVASSIIPAPPYLLSTHDVKVEVDIVFLPLYMSRLLSC